MREREGSGCLSYYILIVFLISLLTVAFLIPYLLSYRLVVLILNRHLLLKCASQANNVICVEKFSDFPQLGRFTLRTEGDSVFLTSVVYTFIWFSVILNVDKNL